MGGIFSTPHALAPRAQLTYTRLNSYRYTLCAATVSDLRTIIDGLSLCASSCSLAFLDNDHPPFGSIERPDTHGTSCRPLAEPTGV